MSLIRDAHDALSTFSSLPIQTPPIVESSAQFTFSLKSTPADIHSFNKHFLSANQCHSQAGAPPVPCGSQRLPASGPSPKMEMSLCKEGAHARQTPLGALQFMSRPSTHLLTLRPPAHPWPAHLQSWSFVALRPGPHTGSFGPSPHRSLQTQGSPPLCGNGAPSHCLGKGTSDA